MTDDLPFAYPSEATVNVSTKRCAHPRARRQREYAIGALGERVLVGERCECDHLITVEKMRMGSLARRRGNDKERDRAKAPGARRVGQYGGPIDIIEGMFVTQSKDGASYFSERYWSWLSALPRTGGMTPRLVVSDGRRSMTVYMTKDDDALHGETK